MIVCRLSDVLEERGLSRRELARRTGLNINTTCQWARGDLRTVDLRVLDAICEALQIQPGALLCWEPWEDTDRWVEDDPPAPARAQTNPAPAPPQQEDARRPFPLSTSLPP